MPYQSVGWVANVIGVNRQGLRLIGLAGRVNMEKKLSEYLDTSEKKKER